MANFRNFTLYNKEKKDSIALNDFDGYLVYTPEGLGIYLSNSYLNVGSKRIRTAQISAFKSISVKIGITAKTRDEVETKYSLLRNFISKYRRDGFCLAYTPYEGVRERYIECDIKEFDKTEKRTSRFMVVPLTVEPRTIWRVDEEKRSTIQDDQYESNEWIFAEDSNLSDIVEYNFIAENQTGEQELSIYGYDKSKLPTGANADADLINVSPLLAAFSFEFPAGAIYQCNICFDNGKFEDGVYVMRKTFKKTNLYSFEENWQFCIKADIENQSIKAVVELDVGELQNMTSLVDFTLKTVECEDGYTICKVEVADALIDAVCFYTFNYVKTNGTLSSISYKKNIGEKFSYIKIYDFARFVRNEFVKEVHSIVATYQGETVATMFRWNLDGTMFNGISNYVSAFLYEIGTDSYNIAMFTGAISKNTVTNDGECETPLKIQIKGYAVNPTIRILPRDGGAPIQTSKINYTIPAGATFEIDSDPENAGAWLISSSGTRTNAISALDQTTNMFLTLPIGTYDIQILNDNNDPVVANVFFKKEYLGA